MRPFVLFLLLALLASAQAPGQDPFGFWVQNAALLGAPIAPGSLIGVYAYGDFRYDLPNLQLKLTASSGISYSLPVIAPASLDGRAEDARVWSLVPANATAGPARIDLESRGTKLTVPLNIATVGPGLFTKDYNGFGPALAFNQTGAINALTAAAVPNREVALFATGLNGASAVDVKVELAGKTIPASWAGSQQTWPGLDQVNFTVPVDPYLGCYVPVAIRVRGVLSNYATLSVHTDSFACAHPLGLQYDELRALDQGESIRLGVFGFGGVYAPPTQTQEYASFLNFQLNANSVASFAGVQMQDSMYFSCTAPNGPGFVYSGFGGEGGPFTISGPGGQQTFAQEQGTPQTTITGSPFYRSGIWQLSSAEGGRLGNFTQSFWIAPIVRAASSQMQGDDLVVTWDPAGFRPSDVFTLQLESTDGRGQLCNARASDGRLVVPRALLQGLQPLTPNVRWSIHSHPAARPVFRLPQRGGSTIPAIVNYYLGLNDQPLLR